jgi:thymidylate kinase
MLIILEGPDGSGKTVLAERLMSRIEATYPSPRSPEYIHKKRPSEGSLLAEYLRPIADYMPRSGRTLVLDRWHLGELVYPEMTDRETLASFVEFRYLEMFLRSRGAIVIRVDTNPSATLQVIHERAEHEPLEERVLEQQSSFSRAYKSTKLRSMTYDRSQDTSDTAIDVLIAAALGAELDTPMLHKNPTYVGPSHPAVVLLGDQRNVRTDHFEYPTAFVPESATSGHFLMNALPKNWLEYGLFGFMNANEGHPVSIFDETYVEPKWVVLGREAEKALRNSSEIESFGVVPHPQYIRRFHHHARDRYGMEIQRVSRNGEDRSTWRP